MTSLVAVIAIALTMNISYAWTSMSAGGMAGTTYASGTIYNVGTMCPNNVNQGYVCDGRNFGTKYLNPSTVSSFCSGYSSFGTSRQYGFGHGVTSSQSCGECAQIRVPRLDGTYNYMTVMMVDHFTWSMEVGTTEIAYLVSGTKWVVGDRADFDFRLVDNCYASFGDDVSIPVRSPTPQPAIAPVPVSNPVSSPIAPPSGGGSSGTCSVSSNWGSMKINPYWGSSSQSLYAIIYNPPASITKFEIRGYGQSDSQYRTCVYQNVNSWQCNFALTEPASVRLNNGQYRGINVIQSMTGSANMYPLTSQGCSTSAYTEEDGDTSSNMEWTTMFAIIIAALIGIALIIIGLLCLHKYKKNKRGKAYFEDNDNDTEDIEVVDTKETTKGEMVDQE